MAILAEKWRKKYILLTYLLSLASALLFSMYSGAKFYLMFLHKWTEKKISRDSVKLNDRDLLCFH